MAGKEYRMAFSIGAKLQGQFSTAFKSAQTSVAALQNQIQSLNKQQHDIAAYQKQHAAIETTRTKLEMLRAQYANLSAEMENSEQASAALKNQMLQKQMQIEKTSASLESQKQKLDTMSDELQRAGVNTNALAAESSRLTSEISNLREEQEQAVQASQKMGASFGSAAEAAADLAVTVGAVKVFQEAYQEIEKCAKSSIAFESSMASVQRTVGGSTAFLADMGEDFKDLSTDIPIFTSDLASIASTAGQLGIAQDSVEAFAIVMAKLATTTDLTADDAATKLAQFSNITGVKDYERLGSVVADLGDATATTASKVVEMSQGMAASASQAGMSSIDILAISAAVGSLGIEAQAGSTAMSTLISTLYKAIETGEGLTDFAAVAGMTADQFKKAWGNNAAEAMNAFIQGLNDTERNGRSAIVILDELGITNVRQTKAILGLASAGSLLSKTISQANTAWSKNTALADKASVMYKTTEAKLDMAGNAANNLSIAIGDALTPAIGKGASMFTKMLEPVTQFVAANPVLIRAITAGTSVFGVATIAVTGYTTGMKLATAANKLFVASIPGLKLIFAVTAGIAGLTAAAVGLAGAFDVNSASIEELDAEFDDLTSQIAAQKHIEDLCKEYRALSKEIEFFKNSNKTELDISATLEKHGFDSIDDAVAIQRFADSIQTKRGELEQSLIVAGADEISKEDIDKIVDLGAAVATDNGELKQVLEILGVKDITTEDLAIIREFALDIASDQGRLSQTLELHGFDNYDDMVKACNLADDVDAANKAAEIIIKARADGFEDVDGKLQSLTAKASEAATALSEGQLALSEMETRYSQLQARLEYAGSSEAKSAIQLEMEALAPVIDEQKTKVYQLESTYQNYASELSETQSAAEYLSAAEQRLAAVKNELAESTDGAISATETETEALNNQVEAAEALAKAKQATLREQVAENATKQADAYIDALNEEVYYQKLLNDATSKFATYQEMSKLGVAGLETQLQSVVDTMAGMLWENDIDWSSDEIQTYRKEVEDLVFVMSGEQHSFNHFAGLYDTTQEIGASWENIIMAEGNAAADVSKYQTAVDDADARQKIFLDNLVSGVLEGGMSLEQVQGLLTEAFAESYNSEQIIADAMTYVTASIEKAAVAAEGMADGMGTTSSSAYELETAISPIITKMQELGEVYSEAYDAAYESMSGQFGLFEQAPELTQQSVDNMIAALESQVAYMQTYSDNLKAAGEMGLADGLLAQLADGSMESAAYLASIVTDGAAKIDELNTAFASVEEGKSTFADVVAEMQTDFSLKMTELQTQLQTTVSEMDMTAEAAEAGSATVQAFADAATSLLPSVRSAFSGVANAAMSALKTHISTTDTGINAYASGTADAERGYALVGENGPEIIWFNGGEQVLDAQETEALINQSALNADPVSAIPFLHKTSGNTVSIEVKPEYNISGGMNNDELRSVLIEQTSNLRSMVEEILDSIDSDKERSVYA